MKTGKFLSAFALLFIFSEFALSAQKDSMTDSITLRKVFNSRIQEWIVAYNSKDAKNLISLYTEDAIYSSSHVI